MEITLLVTKWGEYSYSPSVSRVIDTKSMVMVRDLTTGGCVFGYEGKKMKVSQTLNNIQILAPKDFLLLTVSKKGSLTYAVPKPYLINPDFMVLPKVYPTTITMTTFRYPTDLMAKSNSKYADEAIIVTESFATIQQMLIDLYISL